MALRELLSWFLYIYGIYGVIVALNSWGNELGNILSRIALRNYYTRELKSILSSGKNETFLAKIIGNNDFYIGCVYKSGNNVS